jgi:hypothetical protein
MSTVLDAELSAMQQVALALAQLDEPTRLRVLHWTLERFQVDASAVARTLQPASPSSSSSLDPQADEGLSVSTLDDLFPPDPCRVATLPPAAGEPERKGVSGMLNEFVAEFQDVVREWNAASDTQADEADQRASSAA